MHVARLGLMGRHVMADRDFVFVALVIRGGQSKLIKARTVPKASFQTTVMGRGRGRQCLLRTLCETT
jgi:hypothetical protein